MGKRPLIRDLSAGHDLPDYLGFGKRVGESAEYRDFEGDLVYIVEIGSGTATIREFFENREIKTFWGEDIQQALFRNFASIFKTDDKMFRSERLFSLCNRVTSLGHIYLIWPLNIQFLYFPSALLPAIRLFVTDENISAYKKLQETLLSRGLASRFDDCPDSRLVYYLKDGKAIEKQIYLSQCVVYLCNLLEVATLYSQSALAEKAMPKDQLTVLFDPSVKTISYPVPKDRGDVDRVSVILGEA